MGSSNIGEMCLEKRKGRKAEKARQPQRGPGVAQLEKMRIHNQIMAAYHHSGFAQQDIRMQMPFPPSYNSSSTHATSSLADLHPYRADCSEESTDQRVDIQYYGSHASEALRYSVNGDEPSLLPYHLHQPAMARPFFVQNMEDSDQRMRRQDQQYWMRNSGHESSTSSSQELDLELRL